MIMALFVPMGWECTTEQRSDTVEPLTLGSRQYANSVNVISLGFIKPTHSCVCYEVGYPLGVKIVAESRFAEVAETVKS